MYFSMVVWIASMLRNIGFVFRAGLIHCTGWGILLCADMNPGASYAIHEKFIIIYPPPFWKILKKRFPDFVPLSNRVWTGPAGSCTVYVEYVKWFPDVHNLPCCWHIWYESNHVDHPFRNDLNGSDFLIDFIWFYFYFILCGTWTGISSYFEQGLSWMVLLSILEFSKWEAVYLCWIYWFGLSVNIVTSL